MRECGHSYVWSKQLINDFTTLLGASSASHIIIVSDDMVYCSRHKKAPCICGGCPRCPAPEGVDVSKCTGRHQTLSSGGQRGSRRNAAEVTSKASSRASSRITTRPNSYSEVDESAFMEVSAKRQPLPLQVVDALTASSTRTAFPIQREFLRYSSFSEETLLTDRGLKTAMR